MSHNICHNLYVPGGQKEQEMTLKRIIFGIEIAVIVSELIIIYAIKFC